MRGVRVGRRVMHGAGDESGAPDTADYIAILEFANLADPQAYLRHAARDDLGARFGEVVSSALVYDFELAGRLDDLM